MAEYPNNCGANDDMKVDGKVGIGTASPSASLDIAAAPAGTKGIIIGTNNSFEIEFTGSTGANIYSGSSPIFILAGTGKDLYFGSNNINSQMVLQNGNVGIGTASPNAKLEVDGGDIKVTDNGKGIILRSPDGKVVRRLILQNNGTLGLEQP